VSNPSSPTASRADERPLARLYVALFLAVIGVPWLYLATGRFGGDVNNEMRRSAPRPAIRAELDNWLSFPRRFERWYSTHFAFRRPLVKHHNTLKWVGLHTAPTNKIVHGRDEWIFYADSKTLRQVRGAMPLQDAEIDEWVALLEQRRAWLAKRGCEYLLVIAPAKSRIYPEYLPEGYDPIGPSRQDQILAALEERTDVRFMDLGPALIDERSNDRGGDLTYYKYGTHWTERGALRGWREIVESVPSVFPETPPLLEDLDPTLIDGSQGDTWSARLYLEQRLVQEDWTLNVPGERSSRPLATSKFGKHYDAAGDGSPAKPRVMLFHDSFGRALRPLLARSCSALTCFWRYGWELALIERDRPDLVIDLFIERKFVTFAPTGTPLATQDRLHAGFDAAQSSLWSITGEDLANALAARAQVHTKDTYRIGLLPELEGEAGDECWIAVEVESDAGGLLELLQLEPGTKASPSNQRFDAARAWAPPGRQTLFFSQTVPPTARELWLAAEEFDWTIHSVEARR
jgi:alginate O-acetyltransferase complex protein AlgJ